MTITVLDIVAGPFPATGAEQALPFDFKVFTPSEIEVWAGEGDGVLLDDSLYTVTSNKALDGQVMEGGEVVLSAGAAGVGDPVRLLARPAMTQGQSYSDTGSRLKNLNETADRAVLRDLRLQFDNAAAQIGNNLQFANFVPLGGFALIQNIQQKLRRMSHIEDRAGSSSFIKLQRALSVHSVIGYGPLLFNDFIDATDDIEIPEGVHLQGPLGCTGQINSANYDFGRGTIRLPAGKTIKVGQSAKVDGFHVIHAGRSVPYATDAEVLADLATWDDGSVGVTIAGTDATVTNLMVLGFDLGLRSDNFGRVTCRDNKFDCLNGFWMSGSLDVARVTDNHCFPWLTAYVSGAPGADRNGLFRDGIAYRLSGTCDWTKLTRNFSFGYGQGLNVIGPDHITVDGCSFDNVNELGKTDTIGMYVGPGSRSVLMIACQTAAQGSSIIIDNTPDGDPFPSPVVEIIGHRSWAPHLCHLQHNQGYLNVKGGTWEQNGANEFRFGDAILGATISLDLPNNPAFVGSALALSKVRRSGSHIPDKTFNMVEAFPGLNMTAETNAFKLIAQKLADDGKVLLVPEGAVVDINSTIAINGALRFTGGGTIRMIGVNGPVFQFTLSASVEHEDFGNVHFVNQATGGQPYDESCVLRIVSTDDEVFCTYNNFDDISGQGFHSIIRIEMATRTTSFGQESNFDWNRITRLTATAGVNLAQYGVLMKAGSGTGNTFMDFTTALYDTTSVAAAVRVEGEGCVCGDIVFSGGHLGGSGAILSFGADLLYRSNSAISNSQPDAGLTKICHWDAPSESFAGFDIEGVNIGGGVTATVWPYMSSSVIREVGVGRWEAARSAQTSSIGAKSIDLYTLTYAPRVDGQTAGGIVEVHAGAEVAGVGYDSVYAKYMVTVTEAGIALKAIQGPVYHLGTPLLTLSANVVGYVLTLNLAYTTTEAGGDYDSNLIARGGTLKIMKP